MNMMKIQWGADPFGRSNVLTAENKGEFAMAHLATILFFSGLLVALGVVLELIVKANRVEILAALKGVPLAPLAPQAGSPAGPVVVVVKRSRPHAAA